MKGIIIIGLVVMLLVPVVGLSEELRAPSLRVIPCSGKPADKIALYGAGFAPGEEVRMGVTMSGLTIYLGKSTGGLFKANEMGAIKINAEIPDPIVAAPGLYTVSATGSKGSFATYPLEVIAEKKK